MAEQRSYAFSIAVDATGDKTIVSLIRGVKNLTEAQEALNKAGFENAQVTDKQADSSRRLSREYRAAINDINKQRRAYETTSRELAIQQRQYQLTGENLARYNAVARLGSDITREQRVELADLAAETYRAREAAQAQTKAQAELNREQKLAAQTADAAARAYEKEMQAQRHLEAAIDMSGEELAVFNALQRAGVSASSAQGKALTEQTKRTYALVSANNQAQTSMRGLRGTAQNLGWQMQDVAVQMQMGTNAAIILSQQGSQIASSFGPIGAVVGAGIAVVGASIPTLMTYFGMAIKSADELEKAIDGMNSSFSETDGIVTYGEELDKLFQRSAQLGEMELILRQLELDKTMETAAKSARELSDEFTAFDAGAFSFLFLDTVATNLQYVQDELGLTEDAARRFIEINDQFNADGNLIAYGEGLAELQIQTGNTSDGFTKLIQSVIDYTNASITMEELQERINKAIGVDQAEAIKTSAKALEDYNKNLAKWEKLEADRAASAEKQLETLKARTEALGMSDKALAYHIFNTKTINTLTDEEADAQLAAMDAYWEKKEALDASAEATKRATEAMNEQITQQQRIQSLFADQEVELSIQTLGLDGRAADRFREMNRIIRLGVEDVDRYMEGWERLYQETEQATESVTDYNLIGQQFLQQMQRQTAALDETAEEQEINNFLMGKAIGLSSELVTQITAEIRARHSRIGEIEEENEKEKERQRLEKEAQKQSDQRLKTLGQLQTQTTALLGANNKVSSPFSAFGDMQNLAQEAANLEAMTQARENAWNDAVNAVDYDAMEAMLSDDWVTQEKAIFNASLANQTAFAAAREQLNQQMLMSNVSQVEQMAGTLAGAAEEGSSAYKALFLMQQAAAIAMGTMRAFDSAEMARTTSANAVRLAGGPEPAAQAAGLSAYSTDLALGMTNVGLTAGVAFAGALDKGGRIPQDSVGIVSEYGDELVNGVLVRGPANVTSREDTARIMNGQGGQGGGQTIIQNISVQGTGDRELRRAMQQAARQGAEQGYAMVNQDFKNDRGISKRAARR